MTLNLQDPKPQLPNCVRILRGSVVDRTGWNVYIPSLVFSKRMCEVWDEETAEAQRLHGDVDPVDYPETLHRVVGAADWGNRGLLSDRFLEDLNGDLIAIGGPKPRPSCVSSGGRMRTGASGASSSEGGL